MSRWKVGSPDPSIEFEVELNDDKDELRSRRPRSKEDDFHKQIDVSRK